MNNQTYSRFAEDLSGGSSGQQQHSTMTEPDFTQFEPPTGIVKREREEGDGYESDSYYDEQGRKVPDTFQDYENSFQSDYDYSEDGNYTGEYCFEESRRRRGRNYTLDDMTPTVRDPLCSSDSDVAYLWPVYVSNFRCVERVKLLKSIRTYFYSKGLHVRWHYRPEGGEFNDLQVTIGIYDILVYFVSQYDASLAVKRCHRDVYRGYTMNVFPGRVPLYFDQKRSVLVWKKNRGVAYSEQFFERNLAKVEPKPKISCTVKFDIVRGAIEFATREDMSRAMAGTKRFKWTPAPDTFQKQRFLEKDLLPEIERHLASNPNALRLDLNDKFAQKLCKDIRRPREHRPFRNAKWERFGKQKQYILQMLQQGRKPVCPYSDARRKDVFYSMVRKVKKRVAKAAKKEQRSQRYTATS
nr:uncharacterized protein LOC109401509 [Aedes albopictus]